MTIPMFKNDLWYQAHSTYTQASQIAEALNRSDTYYEGDTYQVRILAGAIHPEKDWIAWIDFYQDKETKELSKNKYILRIKSHDQLTLSWQIPNGDWYQASDVYCQWHQNTLVYIYHTRWDAYAIMALIDRIDWFKHLGKFGPSRFNIKDDIVYIIKQLYDGFIHPFLLPRWTPLDPLPEAKAREMGLLEDDVDG